MNLLSQLVIMAGFDQICVTGLLDKRKTLMKMRYPVDVILFTSLSLPVLLSSFLTQSSIPYLVSPLLSVIIPGLILLKYTYSVLYAVIYKTVLPGIRSIRAGVRELGIDGFIMTFVEKANISMLLRFFFAAQIFFQVVTSKTLDDSDHWTSLETLKLLLLEVMHNMCGTLISVLSLASIISVVSGALLNVIYKIIEGNNEEEESLQPVISGFLFVLLAMQTGMTSVSGNARLQLLFQNTILLFVANQHFVHSIASDLLIKASLDDTRISKHVRPLLPFIVFFLFPYFIVLPLWDFPFRLSWLLAITAFCIELIIKSITSLIVYTINMLHAYTDMVSENNDVLLFYVQAVSGCLEFLCGIFLFVNGAYIFFFESGGFIRLFMMTIHFYCNIYQKSVRGWASFKLRMSSWEKVNVLRAAKQEELDDQDICSICYQEMDEAVALDCNHIFHKNCLQKWLSIQDTCPLCHEKLKNQPKQPEPPLEPQQHVLADYMHDAAI